MIAISKNIRDKFCKLISKILHKLPHGLISWGNVCIILVFVALVLTKGDILKLYIDCCGQWLDNSSQYLGERFGLNLLLAITISIFGVKFCVSRYQSILFNLTLLLSCLLGLLFVNNWPGGYIDIVGKLSYKWLLNILLCVLSAIEICNLIKHILKKQPKTHNSGLLVMSPDYIQDGRKVYAETIAELVLKSPIREKSFAVGIVGEWGAGKTIVLSEIEELLKDKTIVIKFKPWNSKSPESLIDDFFTELRKGINYKHSNIGNIINRYASHIIDLDVNEGLNLAAKLGSITSNELDTLDSLKDDVQKLLADLEKSVVILIDDLDRLDSDELFETLRLIRNTADFDNVAYIVTYDKEYVSRMLESKGIVNSDRYLEKIFTTNVLLPTYEPYILVLLIYNELKKRYGDWSMEFKGLSKYITLVWERTTNYVLNDYIKTYRDAIRFTNHLIQDLEILKRNSATYFRDLNMKEWFFLEMLKFAFPKEYSHLRILPNDYLDVIYDSTQQGYIRIKKISKEDNQSNVIPESLSKLLSLIFKDNNLTSNSICYHHNYYNYFALRILSTEIKQSEFNNLFDDTALDMEYILRQWKGRNPSVNKSVAYHFANYDKRNCNASQAKRFIKAMIKWSAITYDVKMLRVIANTSYFDFNRLIQREVCNTFYDELKATLPTIDNLEYACKMAIASAPGPIDPSEDPDLANRNMLSQERAVSAASIIFDTLVANNPNSIRVDGLAVKDSPIRILLENLTVEATIDDYPAFEHYVLEHLMAYFDNLIQITPETKSKHLNKFVEHFAPQWTDDESINEHIADENQYRLRKIFGKSDNLRHIILNWFDGTDEEKDEAIKKLV